MKEPCIRVGILAAENITVSLQGKFLSNVLPQVVQGVFCIRYRNHQLVLEQNGHSLGNLQEITLTPTESDAFFSIEEVRIGIDFHWERKERQTFGGSIQCIVENQQVRLINHIPLEQYLFSVIASEMNASCSMEYLKVHAIVSRSWLLAQLDKKNSHQKEHASPSPDQTKDRLIQWFDREDHTTFDVCADDHCQRYQGLQKASTPQVEEAVTHTRGLVLKHQGSICDARFYKCCGGITEAYENNWDPNPKPYLVSLRDHPNSVSLPDLRDESNAEHYILSSPEAYCNTTDANVLSQILNDYDMETREFFRWKKTYRQEELSALITKKSGIDFGSILALNPLRRGFSGRIIELEIKGTRKTMTIGKELLIRKYLSETHLYSSAFVVKTSGNKNIPPESFTLYGAGWGHGTGMCQIGAAMMCHRGIAYKEVLHHYYPSSEIVSIYS